MVLTYQQVGFANSHYVLTLCALFTFVHTLKHESKPIQVMVNMENPHIKAKQS